MGEAWFLYFALSAGIGAATGTIAKNKGRDFTLAAILSGILSLASFLIGGLIVLIIYAVLPAASIECPRCHEPNYFKRTTCKSCASALSN